MDLENDLMNIKKIEPLNERLVIESKNSYYNFFGFIVNILNEYFNNNDDNVNDVKRIYKQVLKECVNNEVTPSSFVINVLWDYFGIDEKEF